MEGLRPESQGSTNREGGADDAVKKAQEEQMRRDLLATILDTAARERLSRIALVGPERARQIEAILLRMAQSGQVRGRVSEEQLIELLEQVEQVQGTTAAKPSKVVFQRRKDFDDDFDF